MVDRKLQVGVGGSKLSVLDRKVPKNPMYQGVEPVVRTGKTVKQVAILSKKNLGNQSVAKRKGEFFKRVKARTVGKLLETAPHDESVYRLGQFEPKQSDDTRSVVSSTLTLATDQLGLTGNTEFLLLDLRDTDDYQLCHIKDAISFPAPNITRDRMCPEVLRFV